MPETGKRRPWWASPLAGGFGAVLGVAVTIGIVTVGAHGEQPPHVAAAGLPAAVQEAITAEQVRSLTAQINTLQGQLTETIRQVSELNGRLNKLEGRMEKR